MTQNHRFSAGRRGALAPLAAVAVVACSSSITLPDHCFVVVASVSPVSSSLTVGDSVQLSATYHDVAAECIPNVPASGLHWRSEDPSVATVDSLQGVVVGAGPGTASITAHAPSNDGALGGATVQVSSAGP
jgi:uncharacterized protein YjdB